MTYTLVWRNEARQALSRLRTADPQGAKVVMAAMRGLATDQRPATSSQLGGSSFWRLKLGGLRVMYEVDEARANRAGLHGWADATASAVTLARRPGFPRMPGAAQG
jgi:mRNA-degrading endonuclease RelE of RelBE toxin-antitoxin system